MNDINLTFYLLAKPSFIEGASRVLDLGATLQSYNGSESGERADYTALLNDWIMTGNDIRNSLKKHEREKSGATKER